MVPSSCDSEMLKDLPGFLNRMDRSVGHAMLVRSRVTVVTLFSLMKVSKESEAKQSRSFTTFITVSFNKTILLTNVSIICDIACMHSFS